MSVELISTAMTFVGLLILAVGAATAALSAGVCENDAEKIAAGMRPDYDLKWALIRQSKRLRGGLSAIMIGSVLQMAGTLLDPLMK
jgi:hypothetical protein